MISPSLLHRFPRLQRAVVSAQLLRAPSPRRQAGFLSCCLAMEAPASGPPSGWTRLAVPRTELMLDNTLPTGQSFRWRRLGTGDYLGVLGQRVVQLRQGPDGVLYSVVARGPACTAQGDEAALQDYFNLRTSLVDLAAGWAAADPHFAALLPYFPGARVLRQDPVECLLQFICSSNNHISRIQGMVEKLCQAYGTELTHHAEAGSLHAFPTLQQLSAAREEDLRSAGFGYRAKFITESVRQLREREGGGEAWLQDLRSAPYGDALAALCTLAGVGPKVAACVCLFALDKAEAIPVDTHVWQLATQHYTPHLKGKALTKGVMVAVEAALQGVFGPHAGWAHNTLFVSHLAQHQHLLPEHLRSGPAGASTKKQQRKRPRVEAVAVLNDSEAAPAEQAPAAAGSRVKVEETEEVMVRKGRKAGKRVAEMVKEEVIDQVSGEQGQPVLCFRRTRRTLVKAEMKALPAERKAGLGGVVGQGCTAVTQVLRTQAG